LEKIWEMLFLAFVAGVISLDITAFGHFMISRPIVCAPLFGYLLGDIKAGLWIGMIIELVWVNAIPMGAAIPNDVTAIAVLSSIWGLKVFPNFHSGIILAIALAIPMGFISKKMDIMIRYFNVRIVHWIDTGVKQLKEERVGQGIFLGLLLFFLKAFVFYIVLIYPGQLLLRKIFGMLDLSLVRGLDFAWNCLPVLGLGVVLINFRHNKFPFRK
jgi:mannose PTS system EIIC component